MRMIKNILNLSVVALIFSALLGCVKNIEDAGSQVTSQLDETPILFSYKGIVRVDAISHDKVELVFEKAKEDDKDFIYKLYINDQEPGIEINPTSLLDYGNNRYYFIKSELNIKSYYKFKVRAFQKSDGAQSYQERVQTVQTFDNRVADFNGIINITPVAGTEGAAQPSLRIQWDKVPYFNWGNQSPFDPVRYEVYYSSIGPEDLWSPSSTRRGPYSINVLSEFAHPSEIVVTDFLTPDTTFYFWVRAVHRAYSVFETGSGGYIPVQRENNKKFLSIRTAALGGLPGYIEVKNAFNLYPALQADGLDKVRATWLPAKGNYLKYKLIYFNEAPASQQDFSDQQINSILASQDPTLAGVLEITRDSTEFKNSNINISNLKTDQTYYFKLFLCTTSDCPLTGSNVSQAYDIKNIKVSPMLASFLGINSIDNPVDPAKLDEIKLNFDSPILSIGWATKMEFYCDDSSGSYLLTESANSSAPANSSCRGLSHLTYNNNSNSIQNLKNLIIKGIVIDKSNPKEYCFSATPLLEYTGLNGAVQVRRDSNARIQRCIVPELITPNISEFAGLNSCSPITTVSEKKLKLTYSAPQAGIFQKYVVFWKPKGPDGFSFNAALGQYETQMSIDGLDKLSCSGAQYCFQTVSNADDFQTPALATGNYLSAVMTYAKVTGSGGVDNYYWSQINTSIKDCKIPAPKASFKGWLRIFSIGPKLSHTDKGAGGQFKIREAINNDGIPFEASLLSSLTDAPVLFKPPGQALTTGSGSSETINLNQGLDVAKDMTGGFGSENGIISLAWEDVELDNTSDQAQWDAEQSSTSRLLENRKYGFKVFRSENNRVSWKELTVDSDNQSSVIHSIVHGGKKIFYFTDYTVIQANQDSLGAQRAKVYWYKVVPSYNGEGLIFYNNLYQNHADLALVKVTLPPPNMALVHRWMANRSQCLEINKQPSLRDNYSCTFNGLGAVPKKPPFLKNDTKLDLRGDLLIDRYELGCSFSRGPEATQASQATADYSSSSNVSSMTQNGGCFKVGASSTILGVSNPLPGLDFVISPPLPSSNVTNHLLAGDCIGESQDRSIPWSYCSNSAMGGIGQISTGLIGFSVENNASQNFHTSIDCQTRYWDKRFGLKNANDSSDFLDKNGSPDASASRFDWAKNNLAQSQFGGVYHNTYTGSTLYSAPIIGINTTNNGIASLSGRTYSASCSINLAAIDPSDNQLIPRWVNINNLDGSLQGISTSSKVQDVLGNTKLYHQSYLKAPSTAINPDTKIGRLMTTNRADAPPISGINRNMAEQLCNNFPVDVVVGPVESEITLSSHSKRLLRRREFLAANMWPESYAQGETNYLEGMEFSSSTVTNKWPASHYSGNSCAHSPVGNNQFPSRWSPLPSRPQAGNPFFTGSDSTKLCVSRYGVQDLIGNMEELSSEILHCAYSAVKMNYGKILQSNLNQWQTDGGRGVLLEDDSLTAPQVNVDLLASYSSGSYYLLRERQVPNGSAESDFFTIKDKDGASIATYTETSPTSPTPNGFGPYVGEVGDDAGYCSITDVDPSGRKNNFSAFENLDFFSNSFTRTLNSLLFTRINTYDPLSAINFRDGNGYFLDFGATHLAGRLLYKNSIGFPWDWDVTGGMPNTPTMGGNQIWNNENEQNYFFSHLLGLPLTCGGFDLGSGGVGWWGNCSQEPFDTLVVEKETYSHVGLPSTVKSKTDSLTSGIVNDYVVGGSKITNDGLRDVTFTPRSALVPSVGSPTTNNFSIITGVQLQSTYSQTYPLLPNGDETNLIPQNIIKIEKAITPSDTQRLQEVDKVTTIQGNIADPTKFEPGSTVYYWDVNWALPRETKMNFYQGGHYDNSANVDRHNGRFSLHVGIKNNRRSTGVRCGVLINESN